MRFLTLASVLILFSASVWAQCQQQRGTASEALDINKCFVNFKNNSGLWGDITDGSGFGYPASSIRGEKVSDFASFWVSGFDDFGQMCVSGELYPYWDNNSIYRPGPVDGRDTLESPFCENWDRMWKVENSNIEEFLDGILLLGLPYDSLEIHPSIRYWPGKGNPFLRFDTQESDAPFIDTNGDGLYDPMQGDYPCIKGDQAIWWTMNDLSEANPFFISPKTKIQVSVLAYAFDTNSVPMSNTVFWEYTLTNKNGGIMRDVYLTQFISVELGCFSSDYFGTDSTRSMGIAYESSFIDRDCQVPGYGEELKMFAVRIIDAPIKNDGTPGTASSIGHIAGGSGSFSEPFTPWEYRYYQTKRWRNGDPWQIKDMSFSTSDKRYSYIFPSSPHDSLGWSECHNQFPGTSNPPQYRRYHMNIGPYDLVNRESVQITFAGIVYDANQTNFPCPNFETTIAPYSDEVQLFYDTQVDACPTAAPICPVLGFAKSVRVFPNPTKSEIRLKSKFCGESGQIEIYDLLGKKVLEQDYSPSEPIDVSILSTGTYIGRLQGHNYPGGKFKFIKH